MSAILRAVTAAWSLAVDVSRRGVDDPFGPVGQDPDTARDVACELTVSDTVCFPPEPEPFVPQPPSGSPGAGSGVALGNLLVVLLVAVLVLAIVWLVITIVRTRVTDDDEVEDEELDVELDEEVERRQIDRERPPDAWRGAAAEHRAAGRYRDSIRCEYRALVGDLARAGIVDEIPGRTSGEERLQLAELAPAVSGDFGVAADLFDSAWFGRVDVGPADDEAFCVAARAVLDAVFAGSAAGRGRR